MTFTSKDVKDVAALVARKLEIYMNLERRESRFKPDGYYRTTPKMEQYDLLFRVDDSLAKTDKARQLLGKSAKNPPNKSPRGPKPKRCKSSKVNITEQKKSKAATKESKPGKNKETEPDLKESQQSENSLVTEPENGENERGKYEESNKTDTERDEKEDARDHDDPEGEEQGKKKEEDNLGGDQKACYRSDECLKEKVNPEMEKKTNDECQDEQRTKNETKEQSRKSKNSNLESQENKKHKKHQRKEKKLICPRVDDTTCQIMPVQEVGRLTSFANELFKEQPLEKLQIIHRYRPNSGNIPYITENGKVQNYTGHVGAALHSVKYLDYYLKEGLETGKREQAKRLQELKVMKKMTEKSDTSNQVVVSERRKPKSDSQRRKTALITADTHALVRSESSLSSGSANSGSFGYTSSSYHSDYTMSYVYRESSSSAFSCSSLAASQSSLVNPQIESTSLPEIKKAWMMTPRISTELIPTPFSSREDISAGHKALNNIHLPKDEDSSTSLSSLFDSKYLSNKQQKYYDSKSKIVQEKSKSIEVDVPKYQKITPVTKNKNEADIQSTSLICEKKKKLICLYDEFYDGDLISERSFESRGNDVNIRPYDPDVYRGNQFDGNLNLKEERRGSAVQEFTDSKNSLLSARSIYYRPSAYAYVPEQRGNDQEVFISHDEGPPFYITAESLSKEKPRVPGHLDKTNVSARGILPKLKMHHIGEDSEDTANPLEYKRGTRKNEPGTETDRPCPRSKRASFDKETSLDPSLRDDSLLERKLPVNTETDLVDANGHVSRRASVDKCLPDDLPFEAQYTPRKPLSSDTQSPKTVKIILLTGPELINGLDIQISPEEKHKKQSVKEIDGKKWSEQAFNNTKLTEQEEIKQTEQVKENSVRASVSPDSDIKLDLERNGFSQLDLNDMEEQREMGDETSESRGSFPESSTTNKAVSSVEHIKSSVTAIGNSKSSCASHKLAEQRVENLNLATLKSHPASEVYVPSPRSVKILHDEKIDNPKQKTINRLLEAEIKDLEPPNTTFDSWLKQLDKKGQKQKREMKDRSIKSACETKISDPRVSDINISSHERRHSSASIMSEKSIDIDDLKPGMIPPPVRKTMEGNDMKSESKTSRSSSVLGLSSSRGEDSEQTDLSDRSIKSVDSHLYSMSKTPSRGTDSPQSSIASSNSSKRSLTIKLPLDSHLLISSGRAMTRGVESKKQRVIKSKSSKKSTETSTEEEPSSQQSTYTETEGDSNKMEDANGEDTKIQIQLPKTDSKDMNKDIKSDFSEFLGRKPPPLLAVICQENKQVSLTQRENEGNAVINSSSFSSTSSETSVKDESEPGSDFKDMTGWSISSQGDLGSSTIASLSVTLSTLTFSDQTDVSRGTENDVEVVFIDINNKPPLSESDTSHSHITRANEKPTKSAADVEVYPDFDTTVSTKDPAVNISDENIEDSQGLPETDKCSLNENTDFVLCPSTEGSQNTGSTSYQAEIPALVCSRGSETGNDVDYIETHQDDVEIPVLVCSRGSESGNDPDDNSEVEDLNFKLKLMQKQKYELGSSRELTPRIESRSSSNLSQASLTKVNLQHKDLEKILIKHECEDTRDVVGTVEPSEYELTEYTHPVSLIIDVKEQDPAGLILDLKEDDTERGGVFDDEVQTGAYQDLILSVARRNKEDETIVKEIDQANVTVGENCLSEREVRGELAGCEDNDLTKQNIITQKNVNCILEPAVVNADCTNESQFSGNVQKEGYDISLRNVSKNSTLVPIQTQESMNKNHDALRDSSDKKTLQMVNVTEVKPFEDESTRKIPSQISGEAPSKDKSKESLQNQDSNDKAFTNSSYKHFPSEILPENLPADNVQDIVLNDALHRGLLQQQDDGGPTSSVAESIICSKNIQQLPQIDSEKKISNANMTTPVLLSTEMEHKEQAENIIESPDKELDQEKTSMTLETAEQDLSFVSLEPFSETSHARAIVQQIETNLQEFISGTETLKDKTEMNISKQDISFLPCNTDSTKADNLVQEIPPNVIKEQIVTVPEEKSHHPTQQVISTSAHTILYEQNISLSTDELPPAKTPSPDNTELDSINPSPIKLTKHQDQMSWCTTVSAHVDDHTEIREKPENVLMKGTSILSEDGKSKHSIKQQEEKNSLVTEESQMEQNTIILPVAEVYEPNLSKQDITVSPSIDESTEKSRSQDVSISLDN